MEESIDASKIIIGPIPLSSNKIDINTPFSNKKISLEELLNKIQGKLFFTGSVNEKIIEYAKDKNIKLIDLMQREELTILNTISTAEGAIQIAMQETLTTIHGSNVLIMGFGRVGKITAKMIDGLGANVYCEARKESDIAWIKAYGYKPIYLNELDYNLDKYDIIINTIPEVILKEDKLSKIKKDCLIIDLASSPGGVDREYACKIGIKVIWALALPRKSCTSHFSRNYKKYYV